MQKIWNNPIFELFFWIMSLFFSSFFFLQVYVLEPHESAYQVLQSFVEYNSLGDVITIIKKAPINLTPEECESMQVSLFLIWNVFFSICFFYIYFLS